MNNNTLLVLSIVVSITLGVFLGYFVFLNIFQEQFAQQDRITLENFESATVVLSGTIVEKKGSTVILERKGLHFPIELTEDTDILISIPIEMVVAELPGEGFERRPVQNGTQGDLALGKAVRASVFFLDGNFKAIQIVVIPL